MKQIILKSLLSWVFFFLWIILCFLSIQAFNNWNNVSTVETTTPLTKDLWNTTMNTLTWNIQQLKDSMISKTWDETITWIKNFSNPRWSHTVTDPTHLTTKSYVDSKSLPVKASISFNGSTLEVYNNNWILNIVRESAWVFILTFNVPFLHRNYIVLWTCNMYGSSWAQFWFEWNNITSSSYYWLKTDSVKIWCRNSSNSWTNADLIHVLIIWE